MKKNLLALLLAMTMLFTLTACGGKDTAEDTTEDQPAVEEEAPLPEEEDVVIESEVVDPEADVPAAPVEEEQAPVEMPTVEPEVEVKPEEEKPQPKPEENTPAPDAPAAGSVDLTAFYETLASDPNWPMTMPLDAETMDAFYPGLTGVETKQCGVYMAAMSAVACEVVLVEVAEAADVDTVKAILQSRINYQVGDETNPGGAWYPETIEAWKTNSRVVSNGNCVMMIVSDQADAIVSSFNVLF